MKFLLILSLLAFVQAIEIQVSTLSQLKSAIGTVQPGDVIHMADGLYNGTVKITRSGTKDLPITLTGSKKAIISSTSNGVHLSADNWILKGFTVKDAKKGVFLDRANFNFIDDLLVTHIGEEAVHFYNTSCDNVIINSVIQNTGLLIPGYGEGVYIGTALRNWVNFNNQPDLSHRNQVLYNRIGPNVTAESVDIKEGTEGNIIDGNIFDGIGMKGEHFAESWMEVKGARNIIRNNRGIVSLLDGFQIYQVPDSVPDSGCDNEFRDNFCSQLGTGGQCFKIISKPVCINQNRNINNIVL